MKVFSNKKEKTEKTVKKIVAGTVALAAAGYLVGQLKK